VDGVLGREGRQDEILRRRRHCSRRQPELLGGERKERRGGPG
jgi:hypothetical protein